jgi:hypothetical protein
VSQGIQIGGAMLILLAYVLAHTGRWRPDSLPYLWVNLIGAGVLAVSAFIERQWCFVLLETVWTVASAVGIVQRARTRESAGAG